MSALPAPIISPEIKYTQVYSRFFQVRADFGFKVGQAALDVCFILTNTANSQIIY